MRVAVGLIIGVMTWDWHRVIVGNGDENGNSTMHGTNKLGNRLMKRSPK